MHKKSKITRGFSIEPEIIVMTKERVPRKFLKAAVSLIEKELLKNSKASAHNVPSLSLVRKNMLRRAQSLQIVFVSSAKIRQLNKEFRKKNQATDVLSFDPVEEGSLGELVLSLVVLKRQAAQHEVKLKDELGYMILHGMLHLLGYDHVVPQVSPHAARAMFQLQDKVFDAVRTHW